MEPRPGLRLSDGLELDHELERGADVALWVANHLGLGAQVLVKLVSPARATEFAELQEQVRLGAWLASPHVARVIDHGTLGDGTGYLVRELVQGETLEAVLQSGQPLGLREIAAMVTQLASVLDGAHALGLGVASVLDARRVVLIDGPRRPFVKVLELVRDPGVLHADPGPRLDLRSLAVMARTAIRAGGHAGMSRTEPEIEAWLARGASGFGAAGEMAMAFEQAVAAIQSRHDESLAQISAPTPMAMARAGTSSGRGPGISSLGWRAGAAIAVAIAVAVVVIAPVALVLSGGRPQTLRDFGAPRAGASGATSGPTSSGTVLPSGWAVESFPGSWNVAHVDVQAFLEACKAKAAAEDPEATLMRFSATGVGRDGTANLAELGVFRSVTCQMHNPCFQANAMASGVSMMRLPECGSASVRWPRCSVARVLDKVARAAHVEGAFEATFVYSGDLGAPVWLVTIGRHAPVGVADDC